MTLIYDRVRLNFYYYECEKKEDRIFTCKSYCTIPSNTAIITHRVRLALLFILLIFNSLVFMIGLLVLRRFVYLPEWIQMDQKMTKKLILNDSIFITNRVWVFFFKSLTKFYPLSTIVSKLGGGGEAWRVPVGDMYYLCNTLRMLGILGVVIFFGLCLLLKSISN